MAESFSSSLSQIFTFFFMIHYQYRANENKAYVQINHAKRKEIERFKINFERKIGVHKF